jgi:hypothetical protein
MLFQDVKDTFRRTGLGLALLAACWGPGSSWAAPVPGQGRDSNAVKDLTRRAEFIFRGTVQKPGAANLEVVEASARTAVVRVDEVLKAADTLDDFTGREVTVFLRQPGSVRAGDQGTFFTKVGLLGESLGVLELGRRNGSALNLKAQIASAGSQALEQDLRARVAAADLVASGRILSTRATYEEPKSGALTEHDPLWWEAVLEVRKVVKGQVTEKTVTFWFPASLDAMWAFAPKPSAGQEGTWLLHRQPVEGRGGVYAVADPRDLMSRDEQTIAESWVKP